MKRSGMATMTVVNKARFINDVLEAEFKLALFKCQDLQQKLRRSYLPTRASLHSLSSYITSSTTTTSNTPPVTLQR